MKTVSTAPAADNAKTRGGSAVNIEAIRAFCERVVRLYGWQACRFVCPHTEECAKYKAENGGTPPCGKVIND